MQPLHIDAQGKRQPRRKCLIVFFQTVLNHWNVVIIAADSGNRFMLNAARFVTSGVARRIAHVA
jgi:hypothetical protein